MFFERIGRWATRYRLVIIAAWIVTAAVTTTFAPNIEEVASSDTADFLPDNAPYEHAEDVYEATFPEDNSFGSIVIVFDARETPDGILNRSAAAFNDQIKTDAGQYIANLHDWLTGPDAPAGILSVVSPLDSPTTAALMIASERGEDPALANRVALMRVSMITTPTEETSKEALRLISRWLEAHRPAGVRAYPTGDIPIVSDTTESIKTSVDRTIWVTVALVVIMLLVVYRSPISPLIPLSAVTVAYLITRGIVAYLGEQYMTITSYANVLLVVVMYGAGTDYCLFLISRFREEMADQRSVTQATADTVQRVGETITSSAGTIFVGFMAMIFAEMGIFNTSGPALALGIVISLTAGLTLVPALLATLGDRAFWPGKATHHVNGRLYEVTSKWVSTYPLIVILVIVALMAPLSVYGLNQPVTYDILADLPDDKPTVIGFELMRSSLGAGNVMPLTVVVTERSPNDIAGEIVRLTDEIAALDGVSDVRGLDDPLGQAHGEFQDLLHVATQLRLALNVLNTSETSDATAALSDPETMLALINGFQLYLDRLVEQFPEIADDPHFLVLQDILNNPLQLMQRQDELTPALEGLAARFETIENPYWMPAALAEVFAALSTSGAENTFGPAALDQLAETYLANDGTAFKLDVIFSEAASTTRSMDALNQIRDILKRYENSGEAVATGAAAVNTDIRDTMDRDLLRAIGFVLLGIFIVLLLMLRSVVAPLYLIGTVVLSFTFTLGLTNFVFKTFFDAEGLTWYVPFFAFVFLVALGIDYSIFLFGRIKEEVGHHGLREGVHVAVATTGAIITSAGMILSGTFAAMLAGEVVGLLELGFAVAVGVLIDTFVVRTVLDPALATLFGRWTWWPGGVPQARRGNRARRAPAPEPGD
jgi:RND superfamily putative drug exporter